jgi:hypothetical protein
VQVRVVRVSSNRFGGVHIYRFARIPPCRNTFCKSFLELQKSFSPNEIYAHLVRYCTDI